MDGIGGLGSPHLQEDPFDAFVHGRSASPLKEFNVRPADDSGLASLSSSSLQRLREYIEAKLKLGMGHEQDKEEEINPEGATDLADTLVAKMNDLLDVAAWAQQRMDPDRAAALLR